MTEQPAESYRQLLTALPIALVAGTALLVVSFAWPHLSKGRGEWTKELALQHQSAAFKLHGLTHKYSDDSTAIKDGNLPDDLRQARNDFLALNQQLETMRRRSNHVAIALRIVGIGLLLPPVAMALRYYWSPARRADRPLKPLVLTSNDGIERR